MKKNRIIFILLSILLRILLFPPTAVHAEAINVKTYSTNVDYIPSNSIDIFKDESSKIKTNNIQLLVDEETKTLITCTSSSSFGDENHLYIQEYNEEKICTNTIKINKTYTNFGAFTKDKQGNYYILYSKGKTSPLNNGEKDMVLVKYNSSGEEVGKCHFSEFLENPLSIKEAILNKSKMKIYADKLYIYYSRNIIKVNNNSSEKSFIAVFDLNDFSDISKMSSINISSRDSDILVEEDGLVALDIYNSFKLSKFSEENENSIDLLNAKDSDQIGGIERTSEGYIIAGVKEEVSNSGVNNIFIQTINEDLIDEQKPIYITDYSNKFKEIVSNLKIVQAGHDKYVLLWELKDITGNYKGTYILTVDEEGNIIEDVKSLGSYRLNINDDLSYDSKSNKIYFAINSGYKIVINEIDPGDATIKIFDIKLSKDSITLKPDETYELNTLITPEDAEDKSVVWESSDETIAIVDENGKVLAINTGETDIIATSTVDESLSAKCSVEVEEEEIIEENSTINTTNTTNITNVSDPINTTSNINTITSKEGFERRVIELCNYERAKYGLAPLQEDSQLASVAKIKSQDMASNNYFSHTSPTYGDPFVMMDNLGVQYTYAGENLAIGQTTPEEVVQSWMNSSGHRENILSEDFTNIGVGIAQNERGQLLWTQEFKRP